MVGTIQTPDLPQVLRKGWATLRQWVLPERRVQIRPAENGGGKVGHGSGGMTLLRAA